MERAERVVFEAYGVTAEVAAPPDVLRSVLPPGWRPGAAERVSRRFAHDGDPARLEAEIRAHVALTAPDHVFVHAGAVAVDGRAIVIPGTSFSGKTTLVAELVRAGASYLSDEFAVLDADGRVHPYAKPLSIRPGSGPAQTDVPVEDLGGTAADGPAPVAVVAITSYVPGAGWTPARRGPADGALALLSHTVPAQSRPGAAIAATRRAAEGALVLEGPRGHAAATARALLDLVGAPA